LKKNIWIWNHYATGMFNNRGGRHYWFAENLIKKGYKPTIFCANTHHNSSSIVEVGDKKYVTDIADSIPFVFVKTYPYSGNGIKRIMNMGMFYKNLFPVSKEFSKTYGKPDIILASSVHPLTLVAGIKIAKKFGVPCICEVRDLWPESFVAYGIIKKNNPILKLLYAGEKWIYQNADKLIFTMEGGRDYIIDKGLV
jgi:glycosyltransferase involved in cell wall biosynthesis